MNGAIRHRLPATHPRIRLAFSPQGLIWHRFDISSTSISWLDPSSMPCGEGEADLRVGSRAVITLGQATTRILRWILGVPKMSNPRLAPVQPSGCSGARETFKTLPPLSERTTCSFSYRFGGSPGIWTMYQTIRVASPGPHLPWRPNPQNISKNWGSSIHLEDDPQNCPKKTLNPQNILRILNFYPQNIWGSSKFSLNIEDTLDLLERKSTEYLEDLPSNVLRICLSEI